MFRNYLMVALRNIRKHKGYSLVNIAGLAVGLLCDEQVAPELCLQDRPQHLDVYGLCRVDPHHRSAYCKLPIDKGCPCKSPRFPSI